MGKQKVRVCCTTCQHFRNFKLDGPCQGCGRDRKHHVNNPDSELYKKPRVTHMSTCASRRGEVNLYG